MTTNARFDSDQSLAAKPAHQKFDESARIDANRHLHVRLHRIHTNRFKPVAFRNDTIDGVSTIANRLTARESAVRLDVTRISCVFNNERSITAPTARAS